jgi:hypothetical protein
MQEFTQHKQRESQNDELAHLLARKVGRNGTLKIKRLRKT